MSNKLTKLLTVLILIGANNLGFAQSLPINFESDVVTTDFVDFDGGTAEVIDNPQSAGINTSSKVARIVRDGGTIWSGSKILLDDKLNFLEANIISLKVYTTAPIGTVVKFKLEGDGTTERDQLTTVTNEWETLTYDFTGEPTSFDYIVFMFDFGNVGIGEHVFLFDDIEQSFGGKQIDLPVTFEESDINYTLTDFGGNESTISEDPDDASNTVVKTIKTDGAASWAGTTIGTDGGFASFIPLTQEDTKIIAKVWSPKAGIPIRLKVEDSNNPTHTCETETNTESSGWQSIEFDFSNEATGTATLQFGLDNGWKYNKASIFFNFDSEGTPSLDDNTYYFDDIQFGTLALGIRNKSLNNNLSIYPNPASSNWVISQNQTIDKVEIIDLNGKLVYSSKFRENQIRIENSNWQDGIYLATIYSASGMATVKLLKH